MVDDDEDGDTEAVEYVFSSFMVVLHGLPMGDATHGNDIYDREESGAVLMVR